MTAANIKPGDIVRCDVRGHTFYAKVDRKLTPEEADQARGPIAIWPISAGVTYRAVRPREVVELYRKSRTRTKAKATTTSMGEPSTWEEA